MDLCCFQNQDGPMRSPSELVELLGALIQAGSRPTHLSTSRPPVRAAPAHVYPDRNRNELCGQVPPAGANTDHQAHGAPDRDRAVLDGMRHRLRQPARAREHPTITYLREGRPTVTYHGSLPCVSLPASSTTRRALSFPAPG